MMDYREKLEKRYEKFGLKKETIQNQIEGLVGIEQEFMIYLYATMPLSDVANYEFEVFEDYVKHGAFLYEKTQLSKEMFMTYVLYHRVNNESIDPCRTFFYEQATNEIGAIDYTVEGILNINYFCASHATYKTTDERTCSPLNVYLKGYGRCGEESVFVCSVLRSLGIASRQVYAPRWSHCDDNHAWVEVWIDDGWHFLGACEPEEVLDKGWFLNASSRAMYIRHITFDKQEDTKNFVEKKGCTYVYNELSRYARTKTIEFIVQDSQGDATDALINVGIVNYSQISNVACLKTIGGRAIFETGLGSLFISVYKGDLVYEKCVDVSENNTVVIRLGKEQPEQDEFLFVAPPDAPIHSGYLTQEQKEAGEIKSRKAMIQRSKRERKANLISDLPVSKALLDKDLFDTKRCDLIDHVEVDNIMGVSEEIFIQYVVCPRIYWENITPYKTYIKEFFDEKTKESFVKDPVHVLHYIAENIKIYPEEEYEELYTTPKGVLEIGAGSKMSCDILAVAILRSCGIPSRINEENLEVEYYGANGFVPLKCYENGWLQLVSADETKWEYQKNVTICKLENNQSQLILFQDEILMKEKFIAKGIYQIITTNRIPKGDTWVRIRKIKLEDTCPVLVELQQIKVGIEELLSCYKINDFEVENEEGNKIWISQIPNKQLLIWLEPSKEPTEHILNEIYDLSEKFKELSIVFLLPSQSAKEDKNISRVLSKLTDITCVYDELSAETVARRMYVNPELLPLVVLTSDSLHGRFAMSGYNVGTAEMLVTLVQFQKNDLC